jgi:hypothetical protein
MARSFGREAVHPVIMDGALPPPSKGVRP